MKDNTMQEWADDFADLLLVNQDRDEEAADFFEAIDEVIANKER